MIVFQEMLLSSLSSNLKNAEKLKFLTFKYQDFFYLYSFFLVHFQSAKQIFSIYFFQLYLKDHCAT